MRSESFAGHGLPAMVERVARLLPAQGPIRVFVHHNPLHAFEDLGFEDAAVAAGELLGCQAFLSEKRYHSEFRRGRIPQPDLEPVLDQDLGERGEQESSQPRRGGSCAWACSCTASPRLAAKR